MVQQFTSVNRVWHRAIEFLMGLMLALALAGCSKPYAIVDIDYVPGQTKYTDPVVYVEERWDRTLSTVTQQAHDLRDVLDALATRPRMAEEKYGRSPTEGIATAHRNYSFIVESEAKVLEVSTESRAGTATVDIPPYDGVPDATLQIGPVVKLESIRNSLSFMSFDDFADQPAWADVSTELRDRFLRRVQESVVDSLAPGSEAEAFYDVVSQLEGKTITFHGCFTLTYADDYSDMVEDPEEILITLTQVEIEQ